MAAKILSPVELEQLKMEIEEATMLLKTIVELMPIYEATAITQAIEELARKAGWLLDRNIRLLGSPGVMGPEWTDWCGGSAARNAHA